MIHKSWKPILETLEERVVPSDWSYGKWGIDARGLKTYYGRLLTGYGVNIGQIEGGRPGKPGFDSER